MNIKSLLITSLIKLAVLSAVISAGALFYGINTGKWSNALACSLMLYSVSAGYCIISFLQLKSVR